MPAAVESPESTVATPSVPSSPTRLPRENEPIGLITLVVVQVCFALFPIFAKKAFVNDAFTPFSIAAWRILGGASILTLLAFVVYRRRVIPPLKDVPLLFGCSMLGVALNQGLFLQGIARTTVMAAGLIMCLIPVFTYLVAVLTKQEKVAQGRVLGILVCLGGFAPIALAKSGVGDAVGNLMLISNTVCYSTYLVLAKPLLRVHPPLVMISWIYLFSIPVVPLFASGESLFPVYAGNEVAWGSLALILLLPTVLGYLLGFLALARTRASTSAIFVYVQPMVGWVAAWYFLGEEFTPELATSAVVLFCGIWLVIR